MCLLLTGCGAPQSVDVESSNVVSTVIPPTQPEVRVHTMPVRSNVLATETEVIIGEMRFAREGDLWVSAASAPSEDIVATRSNGVGSYFLTRGGDLLRSTDFLGELSLVHSFGPRTNFGRGTALVVRDGSGRLFEVGEDGVSPVPGLDDWIISRVELDEDGGWVASLDGTTLDTVDRRTWSIRATPEPDVRRTWLGEEWDEDGHVRARRAAMELEDQRTIAEVYPLALLRNFRVAYLGAGRFIAPSLSVAPAGNELPLPPPTSTRVWATPFGAFATGHNSLYHLDLRADDPQWNEIEASNAQIRRFSSMGIVSDGASAVWNCEDSEGNQDDDNATLCRLGHDGLIEYVYVSADERVFASHGETIYVSTRNGVVALNAVTQARRAIEFPDFQRLRPVTSTPSASLFVARFPTSEIHWLNATDEVRTLPLPKPATALDFTFDGHMGVMSTREGAVFVSLDEGMSWREVLNSAGSSRSISCLADLCQVGTELVVSLGSMFEPTAEPVRVHPASTEERRLSYQWECDVRGSRATDGVRATSTSIDLRYRHAGRRVRLRQPLPVDLPPELRAEIGLAYIREAGAHSAWLTIPAADLGRSALLVTEHGAYSPAVSVEYAQPTEDGGFWIISESPTGLHRISATGQLTSITSQDGLSPLLSRTLYVDDVDVMPVTGAANRYQTVEARARSFELSVDEAFGRICDLTSLTQPTLVFLDFHSNIRGVRLESEPCLAFAHIYGTRYASNGRVLTDGTSECSPSVVSE